MRNLAVYASLAYMVTCGASPIVAQGDSIHWLGDYRDAVQEAKKTQKPIFLEYRCEP